MNITPLSKINNIDAMNENKSNIIVKDIQKVNDLSNVDSTEKIDISAKTFHNNNFINKISSNIDKLAQLQKTQSSISNQLEITTNIVEVTNFANNSMTIQLDDKQPQIKELLDNYNIISKQNEDFDLEGIFFDGVVGSKPLSAQEILDAVSQQNTKLKQHQNNVNSEIQSLVQQTKQSIQHERTETKVEFKNIDFEKESILFDANTLNNVQGGIIPSQANGFPIHSEKLLA